MAEKKHCFFHSSVRRKPAQMQIVHRQLRDLIVCSESEADTVWTISGDARGIDRHDFKAGSSTVTKLPFKANCLVSGCGLIAAGSEGSDFLARSFRLGPRWSVKLNDQSCIVNSACFHQSDGASSVEALICTNGHSITQYYIESLSNIRQKWANGSLSVDPAHRPSTPFTTPPAATVNQWSEHDPYEAPRFLQKGKLRLPVPVNHCSVSPDTSKMVAVGDSNEVFLFSSVSRGGATTEWKCTDTDRVSAAPINVGSFSTAWNRRGTAFAVASEGNCLAIYDVRYCGGSGSGRSLSSRRKGREMVIVKSVGHLGAGAMRTVKFSPGLMTELLAFAEHQQYIHVMDARTLDVNKQDILVIPSPFSAATDDSSLVTSGGMNMHANASESEVSSTESWSSTQSYDRESQSGQQPGWSTSTTTAAGESSYAATSHMTSLARRLGVMDADVCPPDGMLESPLTPTTATHHHNNTATSSSSSSSSSSSASSLSSAALVASPLSSASMLWRPLADRWGTDHHLLMEEDSRHACDISGLSWSRDGHTLVSGTEHELFEWRVDGCKRRSFGHALLA